MNSAELREKYLAFFESKGCQRWPSSSLVPDDPSLLLTTAGMVQFKQYFLQQRQLDERYVGTTTVQKCVRTTDIDVIGADGRHLSFFEMLGNFSFGAYFKQEMCEWALEFSTDVLGFELERLHFTVFEDDDETIEIWKGLGIPAERIYRLGEDDNFWRAGPTGPCGPCSELYYDQGPEVGCGSDDCAPGCDCDRYLEYWNCVFTQFDGQEDGSLAPLPKNNIDTGMGLERTIAILNGFESVFDTDILRGLIAVSERQSGRQYGAAEADDRSMRIIADHMRGCTMMISDGVLPSNEGRGYVLRRLLRRAMRHGHLLGIEAPFLGESVDLIVEMMADAYPELRDNRTLIERVVLAEEERFAQTLRLGQSYLENRLERLLAGAGAEGAAAGGAPGGAPGGAGAPAPAPGAPAPGAPGGAPAPGAPSGAPAPVLDGQSAFELHDRYGFPIELTIEIAAEQGVAVDQEGFEQHMQAQRQRARDAVKDAAWGSADSIYIELAEQLGSSQFVGYELTECPAELLAIVVEQDGKAALVDSIAAGQEAQLVLSATPFYAEMGGQVADTGSLLADGQPVFTVADTQAIEGLYAHIGTAAADLKVGDQLSAAIDAERRARIERNHTGTHLLHYALRTVVGDHVKQAGSLVAPDRLRFDFTHFEPLTDEQLDAIEALANQLIMADSLVTATQTSLDAAREAGVIALFGEKYDDEVRVLSAGDESHELCGGTHVAHTAEIGLLKIISEASVGASLRRIEAVTSYDAYSYTKNAEKTLAAAAAALKARPDAVVERIEALQLRVRELEAELKAGQRAALAEGADELLAACLEGAAYTTVVARYDGLDADGLRALWDRLRDQLSRDPAYDGAAALVVGGITPDGSPLLIAAATEAAVAAGFDANALIRQIAPQIDGAGGGRPTMAQAGGKTPEGLDAALDTARGLLG